MILLLSLYSPDTLDNPTGVRSHMCRIRESLLLLLMITEDQQSYIRSMNLIELEPKETQSQQRIRNKILFGKLQACQNMIRCGLLCSTFWADLNTLRIIRESQTSDMPT
ncbi:hypothetical protein AVEN_224176-1 [Araneus ventricosus]|uniref:Uncharacterized protein n=1 Tax=Araneus ventricosus TaxID=182803 RepID=A0A4Y2U2S2_ARAVE|nr:hypothetical protein AVEN_224176-1 [Araneus ventricosus]